MNDDDKTRDFASYFEREYARRPELWAFSYRMGLRVHHNMHLEAMHRVLKHVHMQGHKVRRMDKSIHALMQFMRSKMADRLLKIHKGKWTKHLRDIRSRHQTSLNLSADAVTCLNNNMSKPDAAEKELLLQMLDGNVEVVSRLAGTADHDYATGAGDTVLFEHCYAGGQ